MSTPPNVLFYSKHCVHCKKFSELLFKLPDVNAKFVKISVDVKNIRLPNYVREVPTIVVFDDFAQKQVLSGAKSFEWLNQFLSQANQVDIVSYDIGLMGSNLSDGFSFLDDQTEAEHTFAFLDKLSDTRINVPINDPDLGSSSTVTSGELERYKQQRQRAVTQIPRQSNVDFTKSVSTDTHHKISENDINNLRQHRNRQTRRGPPPRRAPNFQSTNFSAGVSAQSNRGKSQVPYGGAMSRRGGFPGGNSSKNSRVSKKQRLLDSRLERMQAERDKIDSIRRPTQRELPPELQPIKTQRDRFSGRGMPQGMAYRSF